MMRAKRAPNSTDKHVGSRLRTRRGELGMSQAALGDTLGLTFQQIQKYEKGTNRIGASRLLTMARILRVPVSFFFDGAPGAKVIRSSPDYVSVFIALPDGIALARAFTRIKDAKLRRRLADVVTAIADSDA